MEYIRKTLCVAGKMETRQAKTLACFDAVRLKLLQGSHKDISVAIRKGLAMIKRYGIADVTVEGLLIASESEIERKKYSKAMKYANMALDVASAKEMKPDEAIAHLRLACILYQQGNGDQAIYHAQQACTISRGCGMKEVLWNSHHQLGILYHHQKKYAHALKQYKRADRIIRNIASKLNGQMQKWYLRKPSVKHLLRDLQTSQKGWRNE